MNTNKSTFIKVICTCFFIFLLLGCAPQHNYAFKQFNAKNQGVVLSIQGYVIVDTVKVKNLEERWNILADKMSKKPGFIACYLSKGVGNSKLILANSKWQDLESLRNAFSDEKILKLENELPKKQFEHLFTLGSLGEHYKVSN
ncbi:antibiotic biosynthesis monooxygenase family protein [Tenacibaculum amylolyticum]|uniref:antibiotic biosynthesis monooxygenase family protein n=1 Tax=Tenacibaculum amylolyticum TaxID=104269 RepID=UPI0038959418